MHRWAWIAALVAGVVTGCGQWTVPEEEATPTPPASMQPLKPRTPVEDLLAGLRVAPRTSYAEDYRREAFGSAWADVDGNGCNQRDDVLLRDAEGATTQPQGACDHDVVAGTWLDPYTGATLTFDNLKDPQQAQAIQIDHVVALSEAWRSGARDWSDQRRRRFANHLGNLLAVDGPTNQSKGDDDPAAWRPRAAYQCSYATRWIRVKHRWDLAVDPSEKDALTDMLGSC